MTHLTADHIEILAALAAFPGHKPAPLAVLAGHKPEQVDKAAELIADGGIQLVRHITTKVFAVVSSDGATRYLTAPEACTCPAGRHGVNVCYHRVAAQLLAI